MRPDLTFADKSVCQAVALIEFHFGKCSESVDVIGAVANASRRQTIRSIGALVKAGALRRERSPRQGYPDSLFTVAKNPREADSADRRPRCTTCKADRSTDRMGVCVVCRKAERAESEVRRFLDENGPAAYELVWVGLTANGSTCGKTALREAYAKVTSPRELRETA